MVVDVVEDSPGVLKGSIVASIVGADLLRVEVVAVEMADDAEENALDPQFIPGFPQGVFLDDFVEKAAQDRVIHDKGTEALGVEDKGVPVLGQPGVPGFPQNPLG